MDDKEVNELKFSMYSQRPESDLSKDFLDECLGILDNIEDSKNTDCVNWKERAKMDEATKRSGNMLYDAESNSDTYKILNSDYDVASNSNSKKSKPNVKEAKPANEKEEALMNGLADIMGQIEKLDEAEVQLKESKKKEVKKDG